jgi:hypothetical protein
MNAITVGLDTSAMGLRDRTANRKPHSHATLLRREEAFERAREVILLNAGPLSTTLQRSRSRPVILSVS